MPTIDADRHRDPDRDRAVNGRRAKRENADARAQSKRHRAEQLSKASEYRATLATLGPPEFGRALGPDFEVWLRRPLEADGRPVAFVIPAIRDEWPAEIKAAIDRRRRASLYGSCDCGSGAIASVWVDRDGMPHVSQEHEPECEASDDQLDRLFRRYRVRSS